MEGGMAYFRKELPFHMVVQGTINGEKFNLEGKGVGNSKTGNLKGKWVCTTGKLPMSWAAIAATLGNGYKCFASFPNGLTHFFQECMPEGYTQERVTRFQDDGNIKTYHEIHFQKGVILNKVTLQADGFKADSPVINKGLKCYMPSTETSYPFENGVKSLVHHIYPLKNAANGSFLIATQTTVNRPLGDGRMVKQPGHHFTRSQVKQSKDVDDDSEHIIMDETTEGYDFLLLDS